jgi:hypothetical protein
VDVENGEISGGFLSAITKKADEGAFGLSDLGGGEEYPEFNMTPFSDWLSGRDTSYLETKFNPEFYNSLAYYNTNSLPPYYSDAEAANRAMFETKTLSRIPELFSAPGLTPHSGSAKAATVEALTNYQQQESVNKYNASQVATNTMMQLWQLDMQARTNDLARKISVWGAEQGLEQAEVQSALNAFGLDLQREQFEWQKDQADNSSSDFMGILSGALSGAAAGSAFGPWGMAIGAAGGGALGYYGSQNGNPGFGSQMSNTAGAWSNSYQGQNYINKYFNNSSQQPYYYSNSWGSLAQ